MSLCMLNNCNKNKVKFLVRLYMTTLKAELRQQDGTVISQISDYEVILATPYRN